MMHPAFFTVRARRRSAGVGIVTAIFLLVVLAGLGVAMVTLFNKQQQGIALDEQGVRAQQAARAGIEWGLFHRLRDTNCADGGVYPVALAGKVLREFTVIVSCRQAGNPDERPVSTDPDARLDRWIIRAVACAPAAAGVCPDRSNNPDYVRRVIEVQI
ncbi:agglutinin biogenesis protein MshP [Massilia suwonensis]|uniref:Agglutinin biogenesis protein MshP n=1 Tax=Massilia suwonensis TaxID=648895 RepID=A0ABW0MJ52_9BURK